MTANYKNATPEEHTAELVGVDSRTVAGQLQTCSPGTFANLKTRRTILKKHTNLFAALIAVTAMQAPGLRPSNPGELDRGR